MLVDALRAHGIDAWYDSYEIGAGDVVAKFDEGLASCDVGLVVFSANTDRGRGARHEISTLSPRTSAIMPVLSGGAQ